MPIEKTITLKAQVEGAVGEIKKLQKQIEDLKKNQEKTNSAMSKMTGILKGVKNSFSAVGVAIKAAGFAIVVKIIDKLSEALMKNEQVADTVNTVFNSIGIVFKMLSDTLISAYEAVSQTSENFDALGRVAKNVLDIAITPLKLSFQAIKLGILSAMRAWEKSFLGGKGKDVERIKELTESINETKQSIRDTANEALQSGKEIVSDFGEAITEVTNIGKVIVDEFKETFEGVTVASIIKQGQAITQTVKNYGLLELAQQRLIEEYDREAEVQRQIRDDVSLSIDERIIANERLGVILQEQIDAEKAAVQAQIDATQNRINLEGQSAELREQMFALDTEMLAIDAKVTGMQSEQLTNEVALQDERRTNMQELTSIGKTEFAKQMADLEMDAENKRLLAERTISDKQLLADTLLQIDEDLAFKQKELRDSVESEDRAAREQNMQSLVQTGTSIISSLGQIRDAEITEQQNALNKQLEDGLISQEEYDAQSKQIEERAAVARRREAMIQILISTAQGIAGAVKAGAGVPFPANLIAIGSGIAAVLAGVASAKMALSDAGGAEGGGDTPPPPEEEQDLSAMTALAPNIESIDQPTLGGEQNMQAYVVESDISNAQALQEELDLQATL